MFGIINSKQEFDSNTYPTLCNNPKFIGISSIISEEKLFKLIKQHYDNENKEELLNTIEVYKKYKYEKYLDIIKHYISKYE
jgi:hypothetical protein